jgi:hypothetical protein
MGQGDPYWARFGHNALRIVDRERGTDISYNWGLFDFNEPGFLTRFLSGNTRYWMEGFDTRAMLDVYRSENRSIDVQELAISPDAARRLRDFVEWNALPENRAYRYDYYLDNCSTRIRDALDRALNGRIRAATDTITTPNTYRSHTRRLLADHAPTYGGIMLVLGQRADVPLTAWEEMFVPMLMRDHLRAVTVRNVQGAIVPLVAREARLFQAQRPPERAVAPDRTRSFAAASLLLGAVIAALAWLAAKREGSRGSGGARTGAITLATAWSTFAGIVGTGALGMWALTHHTFMYHNENVLQFTPLSLALAIVLPFAFRARTNAVAALSAAPVLALAVLALSTLGLIAQLLPMMSQVNGEMIALALPAHAGVAYAVWALSVRT